MTYLSTNKNIVTSVFYSQRQQRTCYFLAPKFPVILIAMCRLYEHPCLRNEFSNNESYTTTNALLYIIKY